MQALAFLLGVAAFVATNLVLFLAAYPTMPNPGPQSDIRLPVAGVLVLVIAIAVLLGRGGRAFGLGFGTGFLAESLFLGWCTAQWIHPGGTALANAAYERQRPIQEALAARRAKERWMTEVRSHGLDLALGVSRLRLATGCVLAYRQKHGEYPAAKDSLPDIGETCWELRRVKDDESGWRILYSRGPGSARAPRVEFRVHAGPDTALKMSGPLLDVDSRGMIFRRENARSPAFVVGSPLQPVVAVLMDCIRKGSSAKPASRNGVLNLRDLVFSSQFCGRIQLEQVKSDAGVPSSDPNVARLYLPTTRAFVGIPLEDISTSWDITYVPHGKTPADGYDLHVRPMMYGFTGVRSYLLTGGKIYATWEDRRATVDDPLAEQCELDTNIPCSSSILEPS
jgi:hypothetical protein